MPESGIINGSSCNLMANSGNTINTKATAAETGLDEVISHNITDISSPEIQHKDSLEQVVDVNAVLDDCVDIVYDDDTKKP